VPSFARDIRPLFREKDVEEMSFAFDLGQYDDVKANGAAIEATSDAATRQELAALYGKAGIASSATPCMSRR
jgi:hypothetical protein